MRKHYSAGYKAQIVQQMLREDKTFAQLATEHGIHANQLRQWRRTALDGLPSLFEEREATATLKAAHEQQLTDLYAEIGRLTTELTWLKKKLP
jgi:transposase-like protein